MWLMCRRPVTISRDLKEKYLLSVTATLTAIWGGCSSVCKVPLYKTRVLDPATDPMAGSRTHNTIKYINTIKFETSEGVLEQDTSKIPNPPNAQSTCWEQLTYPDWICVYVHVKQCKNISPPWRLIKYDSSPIFFFFWTLMTGDLP